MKLRDTKNPPNMVATSARHEKQGSNRAANQFFSSLLGNKVIHPYSDFLLHDIDTGDGIVQNPPEDTANKLRTVPLWGLRMHPRHMYDLKSLTLENAIERHGGEAARERDHFRDLSAAEKQALITF
jgi:CxxC motif-containing protein (DUF1111 family)